MKKLHLEIDELEVESFATAASAAEERGTVQGHLRTNSGSTCVYHCTFAGDTCDAACPISYACPRTYNC